MSTISGALSSTARHSCFPRGFDVLSGIRGRVGFRFDEISERAELILLNSHISKLQVISHQLLLLLLLLLLLHGWRDEGLAQR